MAAAGAQVGELRIEWEDELRDCGVVLVREESSVDQEKYMASGLGGRFEQVTHPLQVPLFPFSLGNRGWMWTVSAQGYGRFSGHLCLSRSNIYRDMCVSECVHEGAHKHIHTYTCVYT